MFYAAGRGNICFAFRFDFAQMGGTPWSPHTNATYWNSLETLPTTCGKIELMRYELQHIPQVSDVEIIEAMSFRL